jgi:hypothetical protein
MHALSRTFGPQRALATRLWRQETANKLERLRQSAPTTPTRLTAVAMILAGLALVPVTGDAHRAAAMVWIAVGIPLATLAALTLLDRLATRRRRQV